MASLVTHFPLPHCVMLPAARVVIHTISIDYVIFLLIDSQFCAVDETCTSTVMKQLFCNTLSM